MNYVRDVKQNEDLGMATGLVAQSSLVLLAQSLFLGSVGRGKV